MTTRRRKYRPKPHPHAVALRRAGWTQDKATRLWSHPEHTRRDGHAGYTLRAAARRAGLPAK